MRRCFFFLVESLFMSECHGQDGFAESSSCSIESLDLDFDLNELGDSA